MGAKRWTPREIKYLKRKILLDTTNSVVNINEIAKHLKRSPGAVMNRVLRLRREGVLPEIERDKSIDFNNRPYSDHAIKRIKFMLKNGSTVQEIADSLGKSKRAIESLLRRLREKGDIDVQKHRYWKSNEEKYLIENVEFDENGYTSNVDTLANFLDRSVSSVSAKINKLRQSGAIKIKADPTKTSIKAKNAHEQFNNLRFAGCERKVPLVVNTPSKVEVVQVVLTVTVSMNGEEIHQYWTFDGKLLAENKKATLPSDQGTKIL